MPKDNHQPMKDIFGFLLMCDLGSTLFHFTLILFSLNKIQKHLSALARNINILGLHCFELNSHGPCCGSSLEHFVIIENFLTRIIHFLLLFTLFICFGISSIGNSFNNHNQSYKRKKNSLFSFENLGLSSHKFKDLWVYCELFVEQEYKDKHKEEDRSGSTIKIISRFLDFNTWENAIHIV